LRGSAGDDERWRRSVYLDTVRRTIDLAFEDFRSVNLNSTSRLDLSKIESVLFVIDTVNTKVGSNGEIQLDDIRYAR
jgi:hypothetical protein